jgi:DNA primase
MTERVDADDVRGIRAAVDLQLIAAVDVKLWRRGKDHVGLCPIHGERTPSLHVYPDHFHCYGCGAHGDVFDWLRAVRGMSFRQAFEYFGARCDDAGPSHARTGHEPGEGTARPAEVTSTAEREAEGRAAWDDAFDPTVVVLEYLEGRGLSLPPEPVIRFRPKIWWDVYRQHPEMLALVTDVISQEPVGCQITRLEADGSGTALVKRPRINLCRAGLVRLHQPGPILALAEGTETALSVAAIFGIPAWCTLGRGLLAKAPPLPDMVRSVMIAADNDKAGLDAGRAAAAAYRARGLEVLERVPNDPGADFNNVLLGQK